MNKILVSSPRCGSSVGQQYYEEEGIKCSELFGWHEFFLNAPHGIHKSLEWKVDFIETLNCDFHYKLHAFHLFYEYKGGVLYDWFKEFYKGTEIVVLKRKDLWRSYLSLLVHHQAGRKFWHKYKSEDEESFIAHCRNINFIELKNVRDAFIHQQKCLNKIKGTTIYLEDQTWNKGLKWELDYEHLFEPRELENIRRNFCGVQEKLYR
jgi:hypothetical protein